MSGTSIRLLWGVVVADSYQWTDDQLAAAAACEYPECAGDYLVHPEHLLRTAMEAAGAAVIEANPQMFRTELV